MVNVPELRKVLEFIESNPKKHQQSVWTDASHVAPSDIDIRQYDISYVPQDFGVVKEEAVWTCNTTGCLAGWTAMFAGWRPVVGAGSLLYRDDKWADVREVAQEILDLDGRQASALFAGDNSRAQLWRIATYITDGEIETPEEYK